MEQENNYDNLSPENQEKVNTFMAITAIDNQEHAIQFLNMCNYNLEVKYFFYPECY